MLNSLEELILDKYMVYITSVKQVMKHVINHRKQSYSCLRQQNKMEEITNEISAYLSPRSAKNRS